jgi:hypothetical protein
MINGELAKYRIEDRVREGVSARGARQLGARRAAERRVRARRLVGVTAALLSLPFKLGTLLRFGRGGQGDRPPLS